MVNWSGFVQDYIQREPADQQAFLDALQQRGYQHMSQLMQQAVAVPSSPGQPQLFHESPQLGGFCVELTGITPGRLIAQLQSSQSTSPYPFSLLRQLHPVVHLLRLTVSAAVEMWQKQRFLDQRHLIQQYVLLHKQPVEPEEHQG